MGDGQLRAVFTVSPTGVPLKLSIEMTDGALNGLPADPMDFGNSMYRLSIPQKAKDLTAFNHLAVNWNPVGHRLFDVYGKPHFDFHFYEMSVADQMAIPPYTPETAAAFDSLPPAGYIPNSFFASPEGVPQMGKHWIDTKAPENNGGTFTKTFVYGSYNSVVTFYEPMVIHDYMSSGVESSAAFDQPQYFARDNTYYPTKYEVTRDAKKHTHTVSLTDFKWRETAK